MKYQIQCALILCAGLLFASVAQAQWSSDPMKNLALADKQQGNDQVQPKVRPLPNGSWWVSWFDLDPTSPPPVGYDVKLQGLSRTGYEQFVHDGLLVADLTNTSTEDYGLDFDRQGNALIAFLDTREGSNQQVTAAKISRTGVALFGPMGVQLTNDSNFHAAPKIAATTDGDIVVAWTSNSDVVLQKLNPSGQAVWGSGIVLSASGYNYSLSDLHGSNNGSVIVSFVRDQGFGSNRNLLASKFSPSGNPLWGPNPVAVFDGGSLQFGNFPTFVPDGSGGAVFGWYSSSPSLQCFAQHIRADGSEAFPHNGTAASTNSSDVRVSPSVAYLPSTDETLLFWTEEDANQVDNGVSGQKFDGAGNRKWGSAGVTVVPLGPDQQIFVNIVPSHQGALVFWVDQQSFSAATIQASGINNAGHVACSQFPVSSISASKSGLSAGIDTSGVAALAFQDYRNGNSEIFIQNVNPDCTLGLRTALPLRADSLAP